MRKKQQKKRRKPEENGEENETIMTKAKCDIRENTEQRETRK